MVILWHAAALICLHDQLEVIELAQRCHIFTYDSIGVGEDGPTHQPVEHLASLRAIPGLIDLRPADANEVTEAWRVIMQLCVAAYE